MWRSVFSHSAKALREARFENAFFSELLVLHFATTRRGSAKAKSHNMTPMPTPIAKQMSTAAQRGTR